MKKGISPLIAYILLVGFAIATAAFVTNFIIENTKTQVENLEDLDIGYCEGVNLDLIDICKEPIAISCAGQEPIKLKLNLTNKGSFTIKKIAVNVLDYNFPADKNKFLLNGNDGLKPGEWTNPLFSSSVCLNDLTTTKKDEIKLIPSVNATGKEQFCSQNALVLNDDTLNNIIPCPS